MNRRFEEIRNNPGVVPKLLVFIVRYGMWAQRISFRPLRIVMKTPYRIVDFLFCKLLLNCDISCDAQIGDGFKVNHPYGIFINGRARIGRNFSCRGQITIGDKGDVAGCPVIGDDVNVGVGARLIGPIEIGDGCWVGANAVVTHSFPPNSTLAGVPAHRL